MGYTLQAYIGKVDALTLLDEEYVESHMVNLNAEISMILMTEELFDEINEMKPSTTISKFAFLNENIESKTLQIIGDRELAYVESDFFGGEGWTYRDYMEKCMRYFLSDFEKESMNVILKKLGVVITESADEFSILGLLRNRHTEDWIN